MLLPSTSCGLGMGKGNGCLPATPHCEVASSSREKLGVGVQDVVGEYFASMCVFAWRSAWFSGADLGRLRRHSIAMGAAHNELK